MFCFLFLWGRRKVLLWDSINIICITYSQRACGMCLRRVSQDTEKDSDAPQKKLKVESRFGAKTSLDASFEKTNLHFVHQQQPPSVLKKKHISTHTHTFTQKLHITLPIFHDTMTQCYKNTSEKVHFKNCPYK